MSLIGRTVLAASHHEIRPETTKVAKKTQYRPNLLKSLQTGRVRKSKRKIKENSSPLFDFIFCVSIGCVRNDRSS